MLKYVRFEASSLSDSDRLSPLDASFLHLERDVQQLHVGSAMIFEGPGPTYDELCAAIDARLALVPRYRQRVRRVALELGLPVWVDDANFRIRNHVLHTAVRSPGSDRQVQTLGARLMSEHLDLTRPLWEMWLVQDMSGGRWALINKGHHAMIDGLAGNDIMGVLLDREPGPASAAVLAPPWRPRPGPSSIGLVASSVTDALRRPLELGSLAADALRRPIRLALRIALEAYGLARLGAKLARPESVLDGPIGSRRRWGWARADLTDVKRVKNALGGTVNDVVLAAVTGGLRAFLLSRGESVEGRTIRSMVPVSTRGPDDHHALGNQVSAIFADLPVGIADPAARLAAITRQLSSLKRSGMAVGVDAMMTATGFVPPTLFALGTRAAAHFPQRSVSTVTTNVPGPQVPLYLLGRRMTEMFPYIPLAMEVRVTIGIMSYDGQLSFGVTGDHDAVPDIAVLCEGIESATAELVALVTGPATSADTAASARVRHNRG
jgi:diacylglycerol O-acyltransferase / wax synthase